MPPSVKPPPDLRSPFRADEPGSLPHDGLIDVGPVGLPAGHRCVPRHSGGTASPAVLWTTDLPVMNAGATCLRLIDCFPETGLWPMVLNTLHGHPDRPWDSGEFQPEDVRQIDTADPIDVFEELADALWSEHPDPVGDPYRILLEELVNELGGAGNGIAADTGTRPSAAVARDALQHNLEHITDHRIGLVPCRRPADAITVIGWRGARNHNAPNWQLSAVLRSWEARFGAIAVGIGFGTLDVSVAATIAPLDEAIALAVEHLVFCPDNIAGAGSPAEYADQLAGARVWSFWWD